MKNKKKSFFTDLVHIIMFQHNDADNHKYCDTKTRFFTPRMLYFGYGRADVVSSGNCHAAAADDDHVGRCLLRN